MNVKNIISMDELSYVSRQSFTEKIAIQRLATYDTQLQQKRDNLAPISEAQAKEIKDFWSKKLMWHDGLLNMKYYDVYNAVEQDRSKLKLYIPDSFFYAFIDEYFTNPQRSTALDDKNMYDMYFPNVKRPKTIARKVDDVYLNENYEPISVEDFIKTCKEHKEVIVKSAIGSWGGHGVKFWDAEKDSVETLLNYIYTQNAEYFRGSSVYKQYIVQEVFKQHKDLADINSSSVNTIRVMTLFRNGNVKALSSVLRMGVDGSRVDNCSSGGIVCGITEDGHLKEVAYDGAANRFYRHPQGVEFIGRVVPAYAECVAMAEKLAYRFYGASRLISWDFAVAEDGTPTLIEMNISFGELDFHQLCNGPIFGDDTKDIIDEVFDHSHTLKEIIKLYDKE